MTESPAMRVAPVSAALPAEHTENAEAADVHQDESPVRATSLDALRGLFILLMTFGFTIPNGLFPDWMYHRQYPSSRGGELTDIAGLAWRDLTFATFLFTLAAAIPVTMTVLLDRGGTPVTVVRAALRRGSLLFIFALIIGHANPYWTGEYSDRGFLTAIAGYLICFLVFTRLPKTWSPAVRATVPAVGWVSAAALFALSETLFGKAFDLARRDDVIAILAFAATAGILLWLATRSHPMARLAILGGVLAFRLASRVPGWAQDVRAFSPVPWLFDWSFLDILLVVIPGTLAGDAIVDFMKSRTTPNSWSRARLLGIAAIALAVEPVLVFGLFDRFVVETFAAILVLVIAGAVLLRDPRSSSERLIFRLLAMAACWLMLGLLLEPLDGGIRKIPATVSYFFTVTGNAVCLLTALAILLDVLRIGRRLAQPLVLVGQNAMMAYMLVPMVIIPVLQFANLYVHRSATATASLLRSALLIIAVALISGFFSKRRIFWRT